MNLVNIVVKINNKNTPYYYEGVARKYKDIIEYDYKDENFVFDKEIEKKKKSSKNESIIKKKKKEEIIIKSNNNELNIKIKILNKKINENRFYYLYEFDKMKIEFILELEA